MITTNAVDKSAVDKSHEKLAEKRRALGRGLESLLPGPRVVAPAPALPQSGRKDGAPGSSSSPSSSSSLSSSPVELSQGAAGAPVAPLAVELQASAQTPEGELVYLLDLDSIGQNPYQTRTEFDSKALSDLAGSIQAQGVLQPIVVRPVPARPAAAWSATGAEAPAEGKERFLLILGERRFRASKLAGMTAIPAIVKRVSEQQAAEMTLVENLQRQDLHCLEQAQAFSNMSLLFKLTQEQIGQRVGVSREQVSNYLRLLKLPEEVLAALRSKQLTYSHARLLLSLSDEAQIVKIARIVIAKKMSVALLTETVMDVNVPSGSPAEPKAGGARWMDPNVRAAQRSLEAALGMRVRIRDRRGKGKILIEYSTLEDFDRVVAMLNGK
jgi:ParB family chromosome partitioning protein